MALPFLTAGRVEYTDDLFDRRIARQVDAHEAAGFETTQRFVYDGEDLILAFSGTTNALTNRYLYGPATDEILADEKITTGTASTAGTVTWSLGDHLGTIRDLVQYNAATGSTTVVNHVRYDTFGQVVSQTNSQFQPWFAYTGREWDPAAGLYFYRARWYDPRAGRFLSEDPLGFAAGDVNLSRYVGNGATLWVDPSGVTATSSYANGAFSYNSYASYLQSMQAGTGLPSNGLGANQWDLLDYSANFAAGWGDALTFGITDWARSQAQINDGIDKSSVTYSVGFGVGILNGLPLVSASGGRAVAAGASGVIARVGAAQLPYRTAVTMGVRMSRFFATATGYTQVIAHSRMWQFLGAWNRYVSTLRFGRYQRVAMDCLTLQMHHWAIPRAIAKASQSSGLTRLAHAGWNLIPIPTGWNRFIGCSGLWFNMTRA